jgi:drug/metabolite transporter (DMT)-like permease
LKQFKNSGILNLLVVYVVWGSTYLAIRVAVREGSGFTPFMMAGMRAVASGLIMLTWAWLSHQRIKVSRGELGYLALMGTLLWLGGNGLVSWAEQRADSSVAALVIACVPVWAAGFEALWDRRLPSPLLMFAWLIGTLGIVVLSMPILRTGVRADLFSVLGLVAATMSWALGTVLQSKKRLSLSPVTSSAYQMLAGGVGFAVVAFLLREPLPNPVPEAWLAWGYLVVFGSLAFTAYVTALTLLPTRIVTTYAYVNPVIAVFLGWLILNERIEGWTLAGAALVLLAVGIVFRANALRKRKEAPPVTNEQVAEPVRKASPEV